MVALLILLDLVFVFGRLHIIDSCRYYTDSSKQQDPTAKVFLFFCCFPIPGFERIDSAGGGGYQNPELVTTSSMCLLLLSTVHLYIPPQATDCRLQAHN